MRKGTLALCGLRSFKAHAQPLNRARSVGLLYCKSEQQRLWRDYKSAPLHGGGGEGGALGTWVGKHACVSGSLSEKVLFWSRLSHSDHSIRVSKLATMSKSLFVCFFHKMLNKNVSPYTKHSAVYILFLVLWNQREYSEKTEINGILL